MTNGNAARTGKVFGIGLERTGTTSLNNALNILGYRSVHYPEDDVTRKEIYAHFESGSERIDLSILRDHDALTDTPVCCIYRALDRSYPDSKFILTVRDKESWMRSRQRLCAVTIFPQFETLAAEDPRNVYTRFVGEILYGPYAYEAAPAYDAYVAQVLEYFKDRPQQLLVLDICAGEGWSKLAPFLNVPIPAAPFPWRNRS